MKYLYPALALFLLASCSKEKKPVDYSKSDWEAFQLKGHVEAVSEKSFAIDSLGNKTAKRENFSDHDTDLQFDNNGRLILEKKMLANGSLFEQTKFKGKNQMMEYIQYANGTPTVKTTYKWDKTGKINLEVSRNNMDNSLIERTVIRAEKGFPEEKTTYNGQNLVSDRIEYLYDNDTIIIAENLYLNKEIVQYRNLIEYKDKKKSAETKSDINGKTISRITYEYDGDKLVSKINYNDKNEVDYYEKFEYDAKGNMTMRASYTPFDGEMHDEYEYDSNNNKTSWTIYKGDKIEMRALYTFDKYNNMTSYKITDINDKLVDGKSYSYTYDKQGNWIKKTTFVNNKPRFVLERKINYYK